MDTWDRSHWFWLGAIGMRQIKEVMTTRVVTVTPSTPFKEAVEVLAAHKVAAAPVVDEDGWVVGVVVGFRNSAGCAEQRGPGKR
jgi:CBS-domain-containing membrane protein